MNNKPMIDFIVPHYNEPWYVGRKLFLMLSMQRNADLGKIRVIIVQDGKEGALDWNELFSSCPYDVQVVTLEKHSGIPAARNAGIKHATADWIMFCDFDDMFSDVYSLSMILNVLPTNEADLLWMSCYHEQKKKTVNHFVQCVDENFSYTFGKLFRTSFIQTHGIYFNPNLVSDYEIDFSTIALAEMSPNRVFKITTKFNPFTKTFRHDSHFMNKNLVADRIEDIFHGDMYLVDEFISRKLDHDFRMAVAGAMYDSYFILNSKPRVPHHEEISKLFTEFYKMYKDVFQEINHMEKEIVLRNTVNRTVTIVQNLFTNFRIEAQTPPEDEESILIWLDSVGKSAPDDTPEPSKDAEHTTSHHDDKVVVYCGTSNTYENILASIKSLLCHTKVDHIYVLTEDDTFPYVLPDCVTTINVSNQTYFRKDGPNYNNAWSYMCMMRAAFPEMFAQYDKILSLDIDIVIEKDISALWDYNLDDFYYAGVHEPIRSDDDYVNFGVVMMNVKRMLRDGIGEKVRDLLNTSKQQCPEQDAFNSTCTGNIFLLPPEYNYTPFSNITPETKNPYIIHYAGISYWKSFTPVRKYSDLAWPDILKPQPIRQRRVVAYTGTRDIYHWMSASAKSLLLHNQIDHIYFFIEDDSFPEPLPDCITCVNVSNQQFFPASGINYDSSWTYMDPLRFALPYLLPDESLVLSLDDDVIIHNDISAIWDTDLNGMPFAAVQEVRNNHNPKQPYYNFGVVLMDLDRMRNEHVADNLIQAFNTKKRYLYNAQDCLNDICYGRFVSLPSRYNAFGLTAETEQKDIVHYAGPPIEKVRFSRDAQPFAALSWDDVIHHERKGD